MQLLTNSRLKAYRLCPRLHRLSYVDGWKPVVQAPALSFGTAFHAGLENYWTQGRANAVVHLDDEFELARVEALLAGYAARWSDDFEEYETIAAEQQFQAPLVHPVTGEVSDFWVLAGKMDVMVRSRVDGVDVLVEHKHTTQDVSPGSPYWRALTLDSQVSIYMVGARSLRHDPQRCLYDVAVKPRQRPKKGETPPEFRERVAGEIAKDPASYYSRGTIVRTPDELHRMMLDVWDFAERMRRDIETGWHPRNVDACFKWGRPCEYLGACSGTCRIDGGDFVKVENVNPELEKEAA